MNRLTPVVAFAVMSLAPAAAFACALYTVASTTPLDYVIYGVAAGALGVARLWDGVRRGEAPSRRVQLRRFGVWVLLSFAVGIACAGEYTVELSFFTVNALIASTMVLSGIMFPGWRWVRKLVIVLGFLVALPGSCLMSCTDVGHQRTYIKAAPAPENVTF